MLAIISEPPARFSPFAAPFQQALTNSADRLFLSACMDLVASCQ
jgi:hypothetical protein